MGRRPGALWGRVLAGLLLAACASVIAAPVGDELARGWEEPPVGARLRAYWWWLNGNVTPAAITRDLEEMEAKGFGGALLCDAGGADQDGNDRVPHGPDFLSPPWRELYRHALREAARLGLEISLNIQSGWNLGGPMVTSEDAAKKLVWSAVRLTGPAAAGAALPEPRHAAAYYRDLFVVAYPLRPELAAAGEPARVTASSEQAEHRATATTDGDPGSFWASSGTRAGDGPSRERPEWLRADLDQPATVDRLVLRGRPGYGPRDGELQVSDDGQAFRTVQAFSAPASGELEARFEPVRGRVFRLLLVRSYDPRLPDTPRNVQIAEFALSGPDGTQPVGGPVRRPLRNWAEKAVYKALAFSAPDTTPLLTDVAATPGEEDTRSADVLDLSGRLEPGGVLRWEVPAGTWQVLRVGCTVGDHARVSTSSDGWGGYALDPLDADAFGRYWEAVVEPLVADAGPLAGTTLKYLHTDSWEVEAVNWTPTLRAEFAQRRGYDLLPFLPVLCGRIVDSRAASNRFLCDFRKTLGDLAVDHHFRPFRERARQHGLAIHPESGGPHAVPIDAQRCLGVDDVPMSEFWAWSWRHRVGEANRFFVKQPASAAHTYGHRLVAAEGFTTIGPHWQERLWENLKPAFDQAACEGLNLLVWHAFVCSPAEFGRPGLQYFAGTHLNPNVTWWPDSAPFFAYLNRCQYLLQQGQFVADVAYYYGDHVPNFAQFKRSDPAKVLPGFDYDVVTEEVIVDRMSVRDGWLELPAGDGDAPAGMRYRLLVLPPRPAISLPVLRKVRELVEAGAMVLGPRPTEATGLRDQPAADAEVGRLAEALWGPGAAAAVERTVGRGRVLSGRTARDVLTAAGVPPDFEADGGAPETNLDYIHRRTGEADLYFVANRGNRPESVRVRFRVAGRAPELWDPISGQRDFATDYSEADGRTTLPLDLAPYGSCFVVLRSPAAEHPASGRPNRPRPRPLSTLAGPWRVTFDPAWGGPGTVTIDDLLSWTQHAEPGIRWYSGTATYTKTFDAAESVAAGRLWLDLGDVRELARVQLNGHDLGVVWAPPFRVEVTGLLRPAGNELAIGVTNFWPNRVIGDAALPAAQRLTRTNVRKLTAQTPLMDSGLLGPVRLLASESPPAVIR